MITIDKSKIQVKKLRTEENPTMMRWKRQDKNPEENSRPKKNVTNGGAEKITSQ